MVTLNSLYDLGESIELLESLESHLSNPEPLHSRDQENLNGRWGVPI